jgi:hypothetical protein
MRRRLDPQVHVLGQSSAHAGDDPFRGERWENDPTRASAKCWPS